MTTERATAANTNIGEKGRSEIRLYIVQHMMDKLPQMTEQQVCDFFHYEHEKHYKISVETLKKKIFDYAGIPQDICISARSEKGKTMNSVQFSKNITNLRALLDRTIETQDKHGDLIIEMQSAIFEQSSLIARLTKIAEKQNKEIDDLTNSLTEPKKDLLGKTLSGTNLDRMSPNGG